MNKLILFAVMLVTGFSSIKAQTFQKEFEIYSELRNTFSGGEVHDTGYLNSKAKLLDQITACLAVVKNEEQYIQVYNEQFITYLAPIDEGQKKYYNENVVKLTESFIAKADIYKASLLGNKYFRQAIVFFNKNTPSISLSYDTNKKVVENIIHFKRKLYNYSPAQLFWLLEFSDEVIMYDKLDIPNTDKLAIRKKIEKSSLSKDFFTDLVCN